MSNLIEKCLTRYDHRDLTLRLKAKYILLLIISIFPVLVLALFLTILIMGFQPEVVIPEICLFIIVFISMIFLIRGRYLLSVNIIFISTFSVLWFLLFFDPSSAIIKTNTIVAVIGLLAATPFLLIKTKKTMAIYFFVNIVISIIYYYYLFRINLLEMDEVLDYAVDNTLVMVFLFSVSTAFFNISRESINGLEAELEERIQIEKKLKKAKIDAEAGSRAKGEFITNMSHEIRTPINGIMGMAELALDQTKDRELKKIISTIDLEADTLLGIINEVLDFSKIEVGKLEIENIPFDIRHTFEQACSSLAMGIKDKGLEFISFLSPEIPVYLKGDPGRLRQILVNLASNALKFTHKGEILIRGELVKDYKTGVVLRFVIKDTGIGIPLEKQAIIFDSFSQADGSISRKYGGTGLGTTISKQLVELMGGKIGFESVEKKGSTFEFTIPFEKTNQLSDKDLISYDLENKTILIIDNNRTRVLALTQYLKSFGLQVLASDTGNNAILLLGDCFSANTMPHAVLVNFNLPEMDGFEFARIVKNKSKFEDIPIVILTSSGMAGDSRVCKEIGIAGYLTKPVKRQELKLTIDTILGKKKKFPEEEKRLITKHSIAEQSAGNLKVLVVEDYPTNQQIVMKHLKIAGCNATLAENGKIAVKYFKEKQFDLILMDIQMPEMNGYEATRYIRNYENKLNKLGITPTRIPIIAITAHAMEGDKEKCIQADMDDYLTKPLRRELFLSMIQKWSPKKSVLEQSENEKLPLKSQNRIGDSHYPMDYQKALEEFGNDDEFLMEVMDDFFENVEKQLPTIKQAINADDCETIRRESHSIKGGAANLTAMEFSRKAHNLELMGKQQETGDGINLFREMEKEFFILKKFYNKLS